MNFTMFSKSECLKNGSVNFKEELMIIKWAKIWMSHCLKTTLIVYLPCEHINESMVCTNNIY